MNGLGLMGADCGAKLGREGGNRRRRKCEGCQKARKRRRTRRPASPRTSSSKRTIGTRECERGKTGAGGTEAVHRATRAARGSTPPLICGPFPLGPVRTSHRCSYHSSYWRPPCRAAEARSRRSSVGSKTMEQKQKKLRCFGGKEGGRRGDSGRFGKEMRNMVIESISIGKYTIEVFCCYY